MKRILHILGGLKRGGIETFLLNLYKHIDKSKIQFDFLISDQTETDYTRYILESGGRIFYYVSRNRGVLANLKSLKRFYVEHSHEYDTVHYHASSLTNILPLYYAKKFNIKRRIIHSHNTRQGGNPIHYYIHKFHKNFIKYFATDYLACSSVAGKWMYPAKLMSEVKVIPNSIELDKFKYSRIVSDGKRKELGIPHDKLIVGNISRFHPQKNHTKIIEIFSDLLKVQPNALLLLVGGGDQEDLVKDMVIEMNLGDKVVFLGVRDDIPSLMSALDIFLFPSLYEGMPVVLIEAQASGLPCIVSTTVEAEEAKVLSTFTKISLSEKNNESWVKAILEHMNVDRNINIGSIEFKKYDIQDLAVKMLSFYLL